MGVEHVVDLGASRRCTVGPSAEPVEDPRPSFPTPEMVFTLFGVTYEWVPIRTMSLVEVMNQYGEPAAPEWSIRPIETRKERHTRTPAIQNEEPQKRSLPGQGPLDRGAWQNLNKRKKGG